MKKQFGSRTTDKKCFSYLILSSIYFKTLIKTNVTKYLLKKKYFDTNLN